MNRTGPIVLSSLLLAGAGGGAAASVISRRAARGIGLFALIVGWLAVGPGSALCQDPPRVRLVRDLRTVSGPSQPVLPPDLFELRRLGDVALFRGWDGIHGWELWRSDGTPEGTALLADICPGHCSSFPWELTNALDAVYFSASDGDHGLELWRTDGTASGTELVAEVVPGIVSSSPAALTEHQGELYFQARHQDVGSELWATDGTAAGLRLVADARPGPDGSDPLSLLSVGTTLYFSADDGTTGREPWKSDGTGAGTAPLADLCPGAADSLWYDAPGPWSQRVYGAVGDRLVISTADTFSCPQGVWVSDGTSAGTEQVPGLGGVVLFPDPAPDGALLLSAPNAASDVELWRTDGTIAGTWQVADINPAGSSAPRALGRAGDAVYFSASDGVTGAELWRTDGTPEGTALVRDIQPGSGSGIWLNYLPAGVGLCDDFFFVADDGVHGRELWVTDGTEEGTQLTRDINPGPADFVKELFSLAFPTAFDDRVLTLAFDDARGWALWRSDGTAVGTELIRDPDTQASSAPTTLYGTILVGWPTPKAGTEHGVVWRALDDDHGVEPWVSDGTLAGTRMLVDTCSAGCEEPPQIAARRPFAKAGELVYIGTWDQDIWVTDGTVGGSRLLVEGLNVTLAMPWPRPEGQVDALLAGEGLWVSDGTTEGTVQVFGRAWVADPTPLEDDALFSAWTGAPGGDLWATDGTPEGTLAVRSFAGAAPFGLVVLEPTTLLFWADDGTTGAEPWISDGLPAGTVPLADIHPGPGGSIPPGIVLQPIALAGTVFFPADDGNDGLELWASDGTPRGTRSLGDLNLGPAGSDPRPLIAWDGRLYFSAFDAEHGRELWSTDGTPEGTHRLLDLHPGPGSGIVDVLPAYHLFFSALPPAIWNDRLYFAATDGATGVELWSTDGTPGGTGQVADIHAGPGSSSPNGFAIYGDQLFFTATDGVRGYELWALGEPPAPEVVFADGFESGDTSAWATVVP
jgi:ELWxxDGT repeat protein